MNKVFYDSKCGFCNKVKSTLSKLDILKVFKWVSNKDIDKNNIQIDKNTIDQTIILVTKSGKIYLEFNACRYIMIYIPVFWPILPFLFIPFISPYLGTAIYRRISKKRYCKSVK